MKLHQLPPTLSASDDCRQKSKRFLFSGMLYLLWLGIGSLSLLTLDQLLCLWLAGGLFSGEFWSEWIWIGLFSAGLLFGASWHNATLSAQEQH